ncbi:ATP-binding protein [Streptomyces specialis]|uniref:ATP-binding protein n=1 Tax=Streptomyces specialis TaxID=498367 RepID=UPI00073EE925|nr:ATP-binding protein [Streptomyces specialis]
MNLLNRFAFHHILSSPHHPNQPGQKDPLAGQLFAALTAAHTELTLQEAPGAAIAVAWHRPESEQHLRFLTGGHPFFPPAGKRAPGTHHRVLYPPGARGVALEPGEVLETLARLPVWLRCLGHIDALWTGRQTERELRRGGFDDYVAHLTGPFAWLVIAEPLPAQVLEREMLALSTAIPRLRQRENSEPDRVALERAQARYRELSRSRATGMWNVHILVGGADEPGTRTAAALLCAASDLDNLPYTLRPDRHTLPLDQAASTVGTNLTSENTSRAVDELRSPFPASTELLAALARPPRRELPGIRLIEPPAFDVTPERDGPIHLGEVLDDADQPTGPLGVTLATLNRHTFVAGATGAGKSQTVRHLLEELHHAGIPWLVIEPAKAEYAAMAGRIGGEQLTVIRPGDPDARAVGLNPLEPEPGFPLQTHIDLVRALFLAAFEADEPFPQVLSHALTRCYTDFGWDPVLSESRLPGVTPRYPTLADLQRTALNVVEGIGYGKEISDNVRGFIDVRLSSLRLGTPGRFFEGGHPLDVADLLNHNVVLEIEDVGNDQDKAFFIGTILIRLHQHLRTRRTQTAGSVPMGHVTVVEEAHRLLKRVEPGSPAAHAVELFTALLAEIRAYGEGIIVAEQIPAKIADEVIKNTALKIIHRLPAADDREAVGATMNLDEPQSRHIVSLPPGRAVIFTDGMDRPMRIAVPLGEGHEDPGPGTVAPAILRSRSVACGPQCGSRPCLLREINRAELLADDPRLTLWIELLTIAHLVGEPAPRPDKAWVMGLTDRAGRRTLECALAQRIQQAVDNRYTGLTPYYQPEALAQHLNTSAHATLAGASTPCDGTETHWQAGVYRWADVFHALQSAADPDAGPHPDTATWRKRGLHLFGATISQQLAHLSDRPDSWLPDHSTITGGDHPAYAAALARLTHSPETEDGYLSATRFLNLGTTWPLVVLDLALSDRTSDET